MASDVAWIDYLSQTAVIAAVSYAVVTYGYGLIEAYNSSVETEA